VATTAELLAIVIAPPINNIGVCDPTLDHSAFAGVYDGDNWTIDGCVDLVRGISKPAAECSVMGGGWLCIMP